MKKRGFTLVELLAVIIVLSVIALIAVPMILNVITEAKKGAAKESAHAYIKAVNNSLATYMLKYDVAYDYGKYEVKADGTISDDLNIGIKGYKPSAGTICIGSDRTVTKASLKINDYIILFDGKNVNLVDGNTVEEIDCNSNAVLIKDGDEAKEKIDSIVYVKDEATGAKTCSGYEYMGGCYLKGKVTNNYVWYNGFMWRIMGVNADGTIRLITAGPMINLSYGSTDPTLTYTTYEGYAHDWLNEYFYNNLNSTKSIIKEGTYFCSEVASGGATRSTCADNSKVTAKVGLISVDEYNLAKGVSSYLHTPDSIWTMTPHSDESGNYAIYFAENGTYKGYKKLIYGIRPIINVSGDVKMTTISSSSESAAGTIGNYYILYEDKRVDAANNKLVDKATSGEYVTLEGHTYRVVSNDGSNVKLILDGYYEEINPNNNQYQPYSMYFYGDGNNSNVFELDSGIGQKLNGDVLTWLGLANSNKIKTSIWYQGPGVDYTTSLYYRDSLSKTNGISAKVGLIRIGEMLSAQSITALTKNYTVEWSIANVKKYWSITNGREPYGQYTIQPSGQINDNNTRTACIRPVIVVEPDLNITSGTGTWDNPYQI